MGGFKMQANGKYTAKYFRENLPEWKRQRDPMVVKYFFRPLSFLCSAFFANIALSANDVTVISIAVALTADLLFFFARTNRILGICGALLIAVWLLLDCADGNMARCIKKQPYGEFLDALGSYVLVAFLGVGLGVYIFFNGGLFFKSGNGLAIFIGFSSSVFDLLMRLTHQKFIATRIQKNLTDRFDKSENRNLFLKIKDRIQLEFGVGGILVPIIIVCTITNSLDLVILYLLMYNGLSCFAIVILYIFKAMKYSNESL